MANWAKINENNIVTQVVVVDDDKEEWLNETFGPRWIKTSYNTIGGIYFEPNTREPAKDQSKAFRGNYAGINYFYDEDLDAFIPPKKYSSWILDTNTFNWVAPIPYPEDGKEYIWDENSKAWVAQP